MVRLSLLFAPALASLVAGQIAPQSAVLPAPSGSCGGCYLVADVAGIVFGDVATVTRVVQVGMGGNGTNVTSTTIITPSAALGGGGQVTLTPNVDAPPAAAPISFQPITSAIVVSGATLVSPTPYEVFTAYSITSFVQQDDGSCSTFLGTPQAVFPASQYPVASDAGDAALIAAEESFIDALGLTCSAGGGVVMSTIQSMVDSSTAEVTSVGPIRPTPVPVSMASTSTAESTSTTIASTTVTFNQTQSLALPTGSGNPISPPMTIVPGAAASAAPSLLGAAVGAIGLVALLL